jgi:hypothetical protein
MAGEILDGRLPERNCKRKAGKEHPDGDYEVLQLESMDCPSRWASSPPKFSPAGGGISPAGIRGSLKLRPLRLLIAL